MGKDSRRMRRQGVLVGAPLDGHLKCCRCGSRFAEGEAKLVISSKSIGEDSSPLHNRLLCAFCFHEMRGPRSAL